jgi:nitroreductase
MNLLKILNNRYSVKKTDATKKISDPDFQQMTFTFKSIY